MSADAPARCLRVMHTLRVDEHAVLMQHVDTFSRRRNGAHDVIGVPPSDTEELQQRLEQPGHFPAMPSTDTQHQHRTAATRACCLIGTL